MNKEVEVCCLISEKYQEWQLTIVAMQQQLTAVTIIQQQIIVIGGGGVFTFFRVAERNIKSLKSNFLELKPKICLCLLCIIYSFYIMP